MWLAEVNITQLTLPVTQGVLYLLVAYIIYSTQARNKKKLHWLILSLLLFSLTQVVYIASVFGYIPITPYFWINYFFSLGILFFSVLKYNQQKDYILIGLVGISLFCLLFSFSPQTNHLIMKQVFIIGFHSLIILSFMLRKNKNLGDFFVMFGLSLGVIRPFVIWLFDDFFSKQSQVVSLFFDLTKEVGVIGLTIGLLLRIILEHKERLTSLTFKDDLTKLANRRSLLPVVESLIKDKASFKLVFIRLHGLGHINEHQGHQAGDDALVSVCQQLTTLLIKGNNKSATEYANEDMLARLNGTELVFISRVHEKETDRTLSMFDFALSQLNVKGITVKVAIASYPEHGSHFAEILTAAEVLLAQAHYQQNNALYQVDMTQLAKYRYQKVLAQALKQAIKDETIDVHYQPKYAFIDKGVADGLEPSVINGAEALARWSYQGKAVSPFIFIKLAEEYDFIADLDALIMKKAWLKASELAKAGYDIKIAVNYSSISMVDKDKLIGLVCFLKDTYHLSPALLEIEITESAMAQSGNTNEQLQKLRQLGISIAIDDFGTGYSNLSQLQALPLDTIKIDKAFVDLIETNPMITEFIIEMAHKLKLNIVAEGVEQQSQLNWLVARGCQQIQGYLLSKPLTEESFVKLVTLS